MERSLQSLRDAATLAAAFASTDTAIVVERFSLMVASAIKAGGKVMICGNGGSLCDAVHFAEELTGRYRADRPALPAIAIADAGHITCTANDYGFEQIFARGVEALGRPGDILIVLSTSGNSENIVRAVHAAKTKGMTTAALLGKSGGRLAGTCDIELIAPGATADRIQELHMLVLHIIVERVEVLLGHAR
ncbi:MAG: D-sedoheptulose 7-phosphate isomerase [Planctomycetota bacterium]